MGWRELERKLIHFDADYSLDLDDPKQRDILLKLLKEELPQYENIDIVQAIEHAKESLLPPIAKIHFIRWLQDYVQSLR